MSAILIIFTIVAGLFAGMFVMGRLCDRVAEEIIKGLWK